MALLILVNRRFSTLLADFILALGAFDAILGLSGNGKLSGGTGDDRLEGGAGADILNGETGNDTLIGDTGVLNDRVSYADALESGGGFEFSDALAPFNGADSAQDIFPNHAGQVDNFGVEFDNGPDSIGGFEQGIDNLLVRAAQFGIGPTLDTNELTIGAMAVGPQFAYDAGLVEFDPDDAGTDLGPLPIAVFPAALLHAEFLIV